MDSLQRTELLYGEAALRRFSQARVIVFGVGGVGSWCAEALLRTGIGHLTLVDSDAVDVTNINRQLPATSLTVGERKVDVLRRRFLEIRPDADVVAVDRFFSADNADEFDLGSYDVVIDAIDSVASKAELILRVSALPGVKLYSSMGAARRIDPGKVEVAEFWRVRGCPLARALRDRFKRAGTLPRRKFKCVFSEEAVCGAPKGTSMAVTATFGLRLAALALNDLAASCSCD